MKKAWELEYDVLQNSKPIVLADEDQAWGGIAEFEKMMDLTYRMKWKSNVPGSGAPEKVIIGAIQSMENMGYDVTEAESLMEAGFNAYETNDNPTLIKITCRLFEMFGRMKKIDAHPYHQFNVYDSFEKISKNVNFPMAKNVDIHSDSFNKSIYFGWLAQFVGGAYGTAIEGYTTANLRKTFGEIHDYVRKPNTYNDDVTYELAFLVAFDEFGYHLTAKDIALEWLALVPFGWSAEEIALKNLQAGIFPPESGYFNNPYREWIGAQMRAAICGMVAPGDLKLAAQLAFKDGVISHHNNGVLGEVFNAMMVSMAFVETDVRKIVKTCIDLIPNDSEYYDIINKAYISALNHENWESAWTAIVGDFKKYNWIHAYPNAAAEVIALWFGKGDFDETLHIIGMMGYDVDCNAAQIMTIIGIIDKKVDDRWAKPLGTDIVTYCRKYKKMTLNSLTDWTIKAISKHY
ncbi:ADP-ribosylglycohydrolase family protein [Mycoplasmatota bacterium WC30]